MRIFNKMKKMLLVAAASLFCAGSVFADSKTFLLHGDNMTTGTDADGYSIMTGNAGAEAEGVVITLLNSAKSWSTHNSITVDGASLKTIKVSNGAQNSCVLPEGYVATKVTLYSYININESKKAENIAAEKYLPNGYRTCYWKEIAGVSYTEETATIMNTFIDGDLTAPDAVSFDLDKASSFTFTNTGEQTCFVMKIEAEEVAAEPEVPAVDSLKVDEVNVLVAGKTYVLGKKYDQYKVQFTAENDGFLSITPSQKVTGSSLKINGASSTFTRVNGGVEKKGMAAGSVFEATFYCAGDPSAENVYELVVTFEEGTPYSPLALTLASPANGEEWSGAAQYKQYGTKGVPHYEFSTLISADVKASVKIGEKVYENIKLTVNGYNPILDITALPDTLSKAIAAGLIKAGETFTLTLSNIVDKEFAANTLADQTFTYKLASTACTGVESDASTSQYPSYVTFSFDGNVNIDNAKFYLVNLFNNEVTDLTGEVVEGTSVKVTVPAVEGLPSRQYKVVAEGVTDADGKVIAYTNDAVNCPAEEGKLLFTKPLNNSLFNNGITSTLSLDKWGEGYTQVYGLKSFSVTFPAPVVLNEAVTDPVIFTKEEESTEGGDIGIWAEGDETTTEGTESTETAITVSHAISATDPCTVIFTLSQEVKEVGKYSIEFPAKLYWAKDYYSTDADTLNNFGYYLPGYTYAYAEVIPVPVADGTYYMKNVAAGKFVNGANSWGTRASLCEHGADLVFTFQADGTYSIASNWGTGYLGTNGFIDSSLAGWQIEKQENGNFLISLDKTNYLGYSEGSTEVNLALPATSGEAIEWQLISKEELVAGLAEASEENPVDATFFIVGQNFNCQDDKRNAAWQGGPTLGGDNTNFCAEKYNTNFDVYQELTGLPNGYYTLTVQGFYRAGTGGVTATDQNALLYANDVTTPLVNILSEAGNAAITTGRVVAPDGYGNVPDDMISASGAFTAGLYAGNSVSVKVTEGTLRIGVKKETQIAADWTIFDNFELTYLGAKSSLDLQVDTLKALIADANELKASLDATDATHAMVIGQIDQMIPAAQAVVDAPESVDAVKSMNASVYQFLFQTKIQLAQYDAQNAQALMATYENPTDEAGLAAAIEQAFIVSNGLMMNEGSYTLADLEEAVAALAVAKDAFVKENTPAITEVSVSLTHTASSYCEGDKNAYISTVDAEKEHINDSAFNNTWQGAAYAEFSVLLPEGVSVKSATLTWTGIGEKRNTRNTDVYYVNAGHAIDYTAMQGGTEKVNLEATKITSVTFPKGEGATTDFTTDVTDAVKTIVEGGQNYIIFKFTNNPGGGDLVGKGAAEKAPVLTLETVDASAMTTYTVKYVDGEGNEVKTAGVYDIVIGETATVSDEDKAAIYTEDNAKKYIYVSSDKESIVTVADSASNVITATFREAATYNYTVEAVDDSGILARTLGSYSNFEGESVKAPYNAYVLVEGTLYQAEATNKEYNKSLTLTEDNMKVQVVYAPTTIENVVYYQEAEDVEGLTKVTTGNTSIRSSNAASAYAAEADVVLTNLAPGKYKLAAVIYDATNALGSEFNFIAGTDTVLNAVSTAANWTACASEEFTLTANTDLSLAKGGNSSKAVDFVYIQKTGDVASRFDLTAYNDTVAWANEQKATLNAADASEAEVIGAIDDYIASAAQWLAEVEADPEATQADVDFIAQDLKAQVTAVIGRVQLMKLWPEAEALLAEADSVYASYTDPTDEAGLVNALRSFPRSPMFVTSAEELQAAMDTLKAAMEAFIAENNNAVKVTKIAYLNKEGDTDDAIYDALVAGGYVVDALAYADVTLSDAIIESELVGYDVVVLGGSTGSSANLAMTANLLLGKVNVLSTKSFWYKHYGTNGDNPGTADAPSLSLAKVAGYEAHPIYAGIEGDEFAVFNDMGKSTGRYLQSNGSFSNGPEQAAIGTTNGADCIGEAWVDGFGYIIIPVDGLQPSGYLTADGAQLFVNAVEYLIAGEQYAPNAIEGVEVEGAQWPADIYDLSGRMVKKAATSLEGMEKGLYIINGKKVLVK